MKIQRFKKRIGLIGFGCVGQGLFDVVAANAHLGLEIGRICVKDKEKPRTLPAAAFTYDVQEVLHDDTLDIIAELISDPEEALAILRQALQQGKTVVSANKKVVAEHLPELIRLQQQHGGVLLYEASVCGSIPILRTLEAYYGSEQLIEVRGILNGSSNYILTKLHEEKGSYVEALAQAQALGFAEADPALDVDGTDALHKLCIIAAHAYGVLIHPDQVLHFGISSITPETIALTTSLNAKVKLVATIRANAAGDVALQVLPTLVPLTDALYAVDAEFNAIELTASFAGQQFLKGCGAGSHPTGSAVWADITAAVRGYRYTYPKLCVTNAAAVIADEQVTLLVQSTVADLQAVTNWLQTDDVLYRNNNAGLLILRTTLPKVWACQQQLKQHQIFLAQMPETLAPFADIEASTERAVVLA